MWGLTRQADLEDPVGGLHIEQRDHPAVALSPNFASVIAARLTGQPLHQAHPH
jgi:hypothetical protein